MAIIESCLTILGVASGLSSLHSWFTGLKTGNQIKQLINEQASTHSKIQRLSDRILYAPSVQEVHTINESSKKVNDFRKVREILEPVQSILNEDILSTAMITTPSKLRDAFRKDPFELLVETRPVEYAKRPSNPDLLPILFYDNGKYYVGWQTKGALPLLLNCDYSPDINPEIKLSTTKVIILNDSYTNFDFVIHVIEKFFDKNHEEALRITKIVHEKGIGLCGEYPSNVAELKVFEVNNYSRECDYPLLCTMDRADGLFNVVLLDDNKTTMDFVVNLLKVFFNKDNEQARRIMLQIHKTGRAICGSYTLKTAEKKVAEIHEYARSNGHPLLCNIER